MVIIYFLKLTFSRNYLFELKNFLGSLITYFEGGFLSILMTIIVIKPISVRVSIEIAV